MADGAFHSGPALGAALGITRVAVWKHIDALRTLGVAVDAVRGRGYRLTTPLELLDETRIRAALDPRAAAMVRGIRVEPWVDSTNVQALAGARSQAPSASVWLAEAQHAGRGRRGRSWCSPFGHNIYLSLLWRFEAGPAAAAGLSLAAGLAVVQALSASGVEELGLKWPNDLLWRERYKLGGILVELVGEMSGPCHAVVGVGINRLLPPESASDIDQPHTDLHSIGAGGLVSRNALAGRIISALVLILQEFQEHGWARFLPEWRRWDRVAGRRVQLRLPDGTIEGVAEGVDEHGALVLRGAQGLQRFACGEVSVRPVL